MDRTHRATTEEWETERRAYDALAVGDWVTGPSGELVRVIEKRAWPDTSSTHGIVVTSDGDRRFWPSTLTRVAAGRDDTPEEG
jgi:hypothetical protein